MGVLAYELHTAMGSGTVRGYNSRLISVEERQRLAEELIAARRSVDVLCPGRGLHSSTILLNLSRF